MVDPTDLLGTWALTRRIVDREAGTRRFGHVTGTLTLRADDVDGDLVEWEEAGTLTWAGQSLQVRRRLLVRRDDDRGWTVCFDDGSPFHPWTPGRPVVHDCLADTYRGMVATDDGELRVLWDVSGPHKDRRLFTRCRRA